VRAVEQMLDETDRPGTPWTLIEAENKRWGRVRVLDAVVAAIESGLEKNGMTIPDALASGDKRDRTKRG
jgi:hypothetical protein